MDFSSVKAITIPQGRVKKITRKMDGSLLWEKVTSRIPSEYQEVEYIHNGRDNPYIDLGFAFDTACTYYLHFKRTVSQYSYLFGAAENSGKLRCMITGGGNFTVYGSSGSSYFSVALTDAAEMNVKVEMRKGLLSATNLLTGESLNKTTQGEFTMANNLFLFAQNYNGSARAAGAGKTLYSFSYYDKTNTLICELVPCYRKADGKVGLYDRVRNIFLTNANGTYDFDKGADV